MSSHSTPGASGMSPRARTVIRVIIAVIACIALLVPLAGNVSEFTQRVNTHQTTDSVSLPETLSALAVDVRMSAVDISTTSSPVGSVTLDYRGPRQAAPSIALETSGTAARVSIDGLADSSIFGNRDVRLRVEVPEDTARDLDLTTSADFARTVVNGAYRNVEAQATTGMIQANVTTGALVLRATTGYIEAAGRAESVEIRSETGRVEGELTVSDSLAVEADTGSIDLELGAQTLPVNGISVTADTSSVDLYVPRIENVESTDAVGYRVDMQTDAGSETSVIDSVPADSADPVIPISVVTNAGSLDIDYV